MTLILKKEQNNIYFRSLGFWTLTQLQTEDISSNGSPSYDNHDPSALFITGNVREYMTFPLHRAHRECRQ